MSFVGVVQSTDEIAQCLQPGLQALGANRSKISVKSTRDLQGSVDVDACVAKNYPQDPRWDYVFGYKDHIFYVEVHPSTAREVKVIIAKLHWLHQWQKRSAKKLDALQHRSSYHWISSGKTAITKGSKYGRILAKHGIAGPSSTLKADSFI